MVKIKNGDLVEHKSKRSYVPSYGLGVVIESWENQVVFDNVPLHDENDIMVMFDKVTRMIDKTECKRV